MADEDDIDLGELDEDGFMGDEFGEGEEEEAEDVMTSLGLGEDDEAPCISTGMTDWGEAGLKAAHKVRMQACEVSMLAHQECSDCGHAVTGSGVEHACHGWH